MGISLYIRELLYIGLALLMAHFLIPTLYYGIARSWLRRDYGINNDPIDDYPRVSVVIPTYNEARVIHQRLDNIAEQDYPRDGLEIIVVDGGSTDGTTDLVKKWIGEHGDVKVKVIEEGGRFGKAHALNTALRYAVGDVVVIADADSMWARDSLRNAVRWLMIDDVGAVSCNKSPKDDVAIEGEYRGYYSVLRIAESRKYSSPIFHGELAAYRKDLLLKIGGFPERIGADDSHTASLIALMGYRAIIPEDVRCIESVPRRGYWSWRLRRAQHLVQHFASIAGLIIGNTRIPRDYMPVLLTETYLHIVNPWLLLIGLALILPAVLHGMLIPTALLALGAILLITSKFFRTWVTTQAILVAAAIRNLWNKELVWRKEEKD